MIELAKRESDAKVKTTVQERASMKAVDKFRLAEAQRHRSRQKFSLKALFSQFQHRFTQAHDVSDLIEAQVQFRTTELYRRAHFDALTHLPNRCFLHEKLEQLVCCHKLPKRPFSLLFLDLDSFKSVNDELGHAMGDELLRHVSARLLAAVRDCDIVSRLGGDEFVVLLADTDAKETIEPICKRIIREVSHPYYLGHQVLKTSSSIGIACFPQDAKTPKELMEKADEALYLSKHVGKKTFRFYDASVAQSSVLPAFEKAVFEGKVLLQVEPQMDLKQNRLVGASLNVHWPDAPAKQHNLDGLREILTKSSAAELLGFWLLDSGLYYTQRWSQQQAELVVTIPLLASVWRKSDFMALLAQKQADYGVKSSQIQLEFALQDLQSKGQGARLATLLKTLSTEGYQIALSGLGAQALDVGLMVDLQVQEFKFDQAWLNLQLKTAVGQKWLQAMIHMGKALDACVVCPGLSAKHQVKRLVEMGGSIGQGTLWAQPLSAEQFLKRQAE